MSNCIVCEDGKTEDVPLRRTSCGEHWMCDSCLEQTFTLAIKDESKYPPRCCSSESAALWLDDYEDYLPFELTFDYRVKEREYSIQPKSRTYCGNSVCGHFIHPDGYKQDPVDSALCDACESLTCVECKALMDTTATHKCDIPESEVKFREAVKDYKYQRCTCNYVIELTEACNHIHCECGRQFCYICGEDWGGYHACPAYGHPVYDDEGYNQDGFHKDTLRNREGRTRQEHMDNARFDENGWDGEGFNREGFNAQGFDRQGFSAEGLDAQGFPRMTDEEREEAMVALEAQNIAEGNFQQEEDQAEESKSPEDVEEGEGDIEREEQGQSGEVAPENEGGLVVNDEAENHPGNEERGQNTDVAGLAEPEPHADTPPHIDVGVADVNAQALLEQQDTSTNMETAGLEIPEAE